MCVACVRLQLRSKLERQTDRHAGNQTELQTELGDRQNDIRSTRPQTNMKK